MLLFLEDTSLVLGFVSSCGSGLPQVSTIF